MYDVHYLCRARYDSGYSCLPRVSSLLGDCVKLSDVLTMSLSFRSNVNYIPPPQEVSFFFSSSLSSSSLHLPSFLSPPAMLLSERHHQQCADHDAVPESRNSETSAREQFVTDMLVFVCVPQPQDFKHTQSFML